MRVEAAPPRARSGGQARLAILALCLLSVSGCGEKGDSSTDPQTAEPVISKDLVAGAFRRALSEVRTLVGDPKLADATECVIGDYGELARALVLQAFTDGVWEPSGPPLFFWGFRHNEVEMALRIEGVRGVTMPGGERIWIVPDGFAGLSPEEVHQALTLTLVHELAHVHQMQLTKSPHGSHEPGRSEMSASAARRRLIEEGHAQWLEHRAARTTGLNPASARLVDERAPSGDSVRARGVRAEANLVYGDGIRYFEALVVGGEPTDEELRTWLRSPPPAPGGAEDSGHQGTEQWVQRALGAGLVTLGSTRDLSLLSVVARFFEGSEGDPRRPLRGVRAVAAASVTSRVLPRPRPILLVRLESPAAAAAWMRALFMRLRGRDGMIFPTSGADLMVKSAVNDRHLNGAADPPGARLANVTVHRDAGQPAVGGVLCAANLQECLVILLAADALVASPSLAEVLRDHVEPLAVQAVAAILACSDGQAGVGLPALVDTWQQLTQDSRGDPMASAAIALDMAGDDAPSDEARSRQVAGLLRLESLARGGAPAEELPTSALQSSDPLVRGLALALQFQAGVTRARREVSARPDQLAQCVAVIREPDLERLDEYLPAPRAASVEELLWRRRLDSEHLAPETVAELVAGVPGTGSVRTRLAAAAAIGRALAGSGLDDANPLRQQLCQRLESLMSDVDPTVRQSAWKFAPLTGCMFSPDVLTRARADPLLANVAVLAGLPEIATAAGEDPAARLRGTVRSSIETSLTRAYLLAYPERRDLELPAGYTTLLQDAVLCSSALSALASGPPVPDVVPLLADLLRRARCRLEVCKVAEAWSQAAPGLVPALRQAALSPDALTRLAARRAIAAQGASVPDMADEVIRALRSPDPTVQSSALRTLQLTGVEGEEVRHSLSELLRSCPERVAQQAIRTLVDQNVTEAWALAAVRERVATEPVPATQAWLADGCVWALHLAEDPEPWIPVLEAWLSTTGSDAADAVGAGLLELGDVGPALLGWAVARAQARPTWQVPFAVVMKASSVSETQLAATARALASGSGPEAVALVRSLVEDYAETPRLRRVLERAASDDRIDPGLATAIRDALR